MVYAVKKFRHYLLANKFIFFVDHQALLYLVNKPCATGRIVRWFIILLEFDFEVAVQKGLTHQRADHLSRITSGEAPIGVEDDMPDSTLFLVETAPKWSEPILDILTTGQVQLQNNNTIWRPYKLISGRLYKQGFDGVLRLIPNPDHYDDILRYAHVGIGNIHVSATTCVQRFTRDGQWWPTLQEDAEDFVGKCIRCQDKRPVQYATLFQISTTPNWSKYIVTYLKHGHIDIEAPKP